MPGPTRLPGLAGGLRDGASGGRPACGGALGKAWKGNRHLRRHP